MNAEERKAAEQLVQLSLRRRALERVEGALADGELAREITSQLNIPDSEELRDVIKLAGKPIALELENAHRKQAAGNFWARNQHQKWLIYPLLGIVLLIGLGLRIDRIGQQSEWLDEYWAVYLATGRGNEIFNLPYGKVINPPPVCGFAGAPHIWHIWTGLSGVTHPPLYYLALRVWIDFFGDGDVATRGLSVFFSLAAIALMFDAVRRSSNSTAQALAVALMMALASAQIDYSQTTRPYTMIECMALLSADVLLMVRSKGVTVWRAAALFAAFVTTAITHYFTAGFFVAVGIYSLIGLKGKARKTAIIALAAAFVFVVMAWGPMFWRSRGLMAVVNLDEQGKGFGLVWSFVNLPRRLLVHMSMETGFLAMWGLAILVYVTPLVRLRRHGGLLLWWLWALCAPGFLLVWDEVHHTHLIAVTRYVLIASPAIFAILATPLPTKIGQWMPAVFVIAAAAGAFARWQVGPMVNPDLRAGARLVERVPASDPIIIFADLYPGEPPFYYFAIAHYVGKWTHPVVFLQKPADGALMEELKRYPRVWIWCSDGANDRNVLPGWKVKGVGRAAEYRLSEASSR